MNKQEWIRQIRSEVPRRALPVLSFPGLEFTGASVHEAVTDGEKQAAGMKAIAERFPTAAAVTFMDLSVEAETFGSKIRFIDNEVPTVIGRVIETEADLDTLRRPVVGDGRTGEYLKAARVAKALITDRPVLSGMIGPYSLSGRLMDMTELMVNLSEEPEYVHRVLQIATDFLVEYAKAMKATGADGVIIAEPAAGLISPNQCHEFSSPYVKQIVDAVKDDSFFVILHNCGNTVNMVASMVSTGADGLHFGNAVDMKDILPQVPDHVLAFGNLAPAQVFRNGSVADVVNGVTRLKALAAQCPNFLISSGCDIPPGTPMKNIETFFGQIMAQ